MDRKKQFKRSMIDCIKQMTLAHVDKFLSLGGKVNKLYHKTTLLCEASRRGNVEAAHRLLSEGAQVNLSDSNGCSPLYLAASHGNEKLLQVLLHEGAAVNAKNRNGFTPLVSTLQNSHNECAKLLIDNGACVNTDRPKNMYGATVSLLTYILFTKGDWDMAEYLLKAGIRPTKFIPPLGFILLDDPTTPVLLIRKFVHSGFDVHVRGWVHMIKQRGDDLTNSQRELIALLEYERQNVPCLQRLCRTVIRTELSSSHFQGRHLTHKIDSLPLPMEVHKYLKLEYL